MLAQSSEVGVVDGTLCQLAYCNLKEDSPDRIRPNASAPFPFASRIKITPNNLFITYIFFPESVPTMLQNHEDSISTTIKFIGFTLKTDDVIELSHFSFFKTEHITADLHAGGTLKARTWRRVPPP